MRELPLLGQLGESGAQSTRLSDLQVQVLICCFLCGGHPQAQSAKNKMSACTVRLCCQGHSAVWALAYRTFAALLPVAATVYLGDLCLIDLPGCLALLFHWSHMGVPMFDVSNRIIVLMFQIVPLSRCFKFYCFDVSNFCFCTCYVRMLD